MDRNIIDPGRKVWECKYCSIAAEAVSSPAHARPSYAQNRVCF